MSVLDKLEKEWEQDKFHNLSRWNEEPPEDEDIQQRWDFRLKESHKFVQARTWEGDGEQAGLYGFFAEVAVDDAASPGVGERIELPATFLSANAFEASGEDAWKAKRAREFVAHMIGGIVNKRPTKGLLTDILGVAKKEDFEVEDYAALVAKLAEAWPKLEGRSAIPVCHYFKFRPKDNPAELVGPKLKIEGWQPSPIDSPTPF